MVGVPDSVIVRVNSSTSVKVDAGRVMVDAGRVTTCVVPGAVRVTVETSVMVVGVPACVIVRVKLSISVNVDAGKVWVRVTEIVLAGRVEYLVVLYV